MIFQNFPQISLNFHQFDDDLNCKQQIKMYTLLVYKTYHMRKGLIFKLTNFMGRP